METTKSGCVRWMSLMIRSLDVADDRAEVRAVQRDELLPEHLSAGVSRVLVDPVGGDLSVVVVGRH